MKGGNEVSSQKQCHRLKKLRQERDYQAARANWEARRPPRLAFWKYSRWLKEEPKKGDY